MFRHLLFASAVALISMPASAQSFQQMDSETGCLSKYSDEKKATIFEQKYKGRQFTWSGTISQAENGDINLKMLPGTATSDLIISLAADDDGSALASLNKIAGILGAKTDKKASTYDLEPLAERLTEAIFSCRAG